ncbi:MAG TPA: tetratricopeptide repeat protein [Candidatus Binataceae bacterium]|nr:tetratricopeptide repeat protein [Candidatus Binataceae bacterium]
MLATVVGGVTLLTAAATTFSGECKRKPEYPSIEEDIKQLAERAKRGEPDAQFVLGLDYEIGFGVDRSYSTAKDWYQAAADQGDAEAQFRLGRLWEEAKDHPPPNYGKAAVWYRKAAEQGNPDAQTRLGSLYERGRGVMRDDAEAAQWYRKAAEQGNPNAQYRLGLLYELGRGVPQDSAEAAAFYRKAAVVIDIGSLGLDGFGYNGDASLALARLYHYGRGVRQDDAEAYFWIRYALDIDETDTQFAALLYAVKSRLTPDQILQADKRKSQMEMQGSASMYSKRRMDALIQKGHRAYHVPNQN